MTGIQQHRGADYLWKTAGGDSFEADAHLKNFTLLCGACGTVQPDGKRFPALVPWLDEQHPVCAHCVARGTVPDPRLEPAPQPMSDRARQVEDLVQAQLEAENEKEMLRRERIDLAIARGDVAAAVALGAGPGAFKTASPSVRAHAASLLAAEGRRVDDHGAPVARPPGEDGRGEYDRDGSAATLETIGRPPVGESRSAPPERPGADGGGPRVEARRDAGPAQPPVPLRPPVAEPRTEAGESPLDYFIRTQLGD